MKYSKEMTHDIVELLKEGGNRTDVVKIVGIHYDTFMEWMKRTEFSEAIKKAEAEGKQEHIRVIKKAAEKTWTAAAWWLERKYPNEFGLKNREADQSERDEIPQRMAERAAALLKRLEARPKDVSTNGNGVHP